MGVISSPVRLRMAALALALCALLAAVQVAIHAGTPSWNPPVARMSLFSAGAAAALLPLSFLMVRGKLWVSRAVRSVLASWVLLSGALALAGNNASLGFFTIFQLLVFAGVSVWVETELGRSFMNPKMRWYQGLPAAIPSLRCELPGELQEDPSGGLRQEFRVARLDREGAYLFRTSAGAPDPGSRLSRELVFRLRDHEIRCRGVPIAYFDRGGSIGSGMGFRFLEMTADRRKDLGDFVELLEGEGYVL